MLENQSQSMTDPIKCAVLINKPANPWNQAELKIELEHQDGSPVSKNEMDLVDIGRDQWKYKYGMDGDNIDKFSWSLINLTNDINHKWLERVFAVTFRTIGMIIDKKYQKDNSGSYTHFRDEFTHDLEVFDDRTNVLAQQYLFHPQNDKRFNGLGQWNDNHFFTPFGDLIPAHLVDGVHYTEGEKDVNGNILMLPTQPMLHINMHEKKHGHGYYHDMNSPESIMYPFAKKGYNPVNVNGKLEWELNEKAFLWTEDDIKRWHEGYPKRSGLGSWLGRMRIRRLRGRSVPEVPYQVAV
jgi:hypothetical protein